MNKRMQERTMHARLWRNGHPVLAGATLLFLLLSRPTLAWSNDGDFPGDGGPGLPGEEFCVPVEPYQGINAVPAFTMQVLPSSGGDTVVNDAEYPPGPEPRVVVGYWEHQDGYEPEEIEPGVWENPCAGEPTMKIAYPLPYGSETCFGWKHWVLEDDGEFDLHPNSARNMACSEEGDFSFNQWTTMDCTPEGPVGEEGTPKTVHQAMCCRDNPPVIWSLILSGCGKEPPTHEPR